MQNGWAVPFNETLMNSPETQSRITQLRHLAMERELTAEEMREVIVALREDRVSAFHASSTSRKTKAGAKSKAKASAELPFADDLLSDM